MSKIIIKKAKILNNNLKILHIIRNLMRSYKIPSVMIPFHIFELFKLFYVKKIQFLSIHFCKRVIL